MLRNKSFEIGTRRMDYYPTDGATGEALRYLEHAPCIFGAGFREYVTPKGDRVNLVPAYNPLDFIEVIGSELQRNGETYSLVELSQVREQFREAYLEIKDELNPSARQEMLSTYAASLRQMRVLEEQKQADESRRQLEVRVNVETPLPNREDPQAALQSLLAQLDKSRYIAGIAAVTLSDTDSPQEYIHTVAAELSATGETYSAAELKQIRDNLRQAYQKAKNSANTPVELSGLLSAYRKTLGKASYLEQQRMAVEGKDFTSILADENKTVYERLVLVRFWLMAQEKDKLYSRTGFYTLNSIRHGVESLLEDKVKSGDALDTASMNAYHRLQEQCTEIQDTLERKMGLTPNVSAIEVAAFPTEGEKQSLEVKVIPFERKRKPLKQRVVSGIKRAAVAATLTLACVFWGGESLNTENRDAVSLDAYVLTDVAPPVYNGTEEEVPFIRNLLEEKVIPSQTKVDVLPKKAVKHLLKKGDTVWGLAGKYYLNHKRFGEILEANNNPDSRELEVGTELVIPDVVPIAETNYLVQKGDGYWKIAAAKYSDPFMHPEICRINKCKKLHPGMTLVLPGTEF